MRNPRAQHAKPLGVRLDAQALARTWAAYLHGHGIQDRNRLVEHYITLVMYQANRIGCPASRREGPHQHVAAGIFGLMQSIERFDPKRGIKFETYASMRIFGSIIDEIRITGTVTRVHMKRLQEQDSGVFRPIGRLRADGGVAAKVFLMSELHLTSKNRMEEREILDRGASNPASNAERRDFWEDVCRGVNPSESLLLRLYFQQGMKLKSIGRVLELSESRCSQLMASILKRLKSRIGASHMNIERIQN